MTSFLSVFRNFAPLRSVFLSALPPRNRNMIPLDSQIFGTLFANTDNFLFDCDGVLWHGNTLLPGAVEALTKLKSQGKKLYFVTNNSTSTRAQYAVKCQKLGLPAEEADIVCSAHSAALYLKEILKVPDTPNGSPPPKVYVMGSPALESALTEVGLHCIGVGADVVPEDFSQDNWRAIHLEKDIQAVVVGFDKHISFLKITKAASYLKDPAVHFVATNTDKSFPSASSAINIPGTGCIVATVQMASGRDPVVIGKPETRMIDALKIEYNLDASRSVFVGDRLDTDIWLAKNCGLKSIFVLSGVSTLQQAETFAKSTSAAELACVPDFYMDGVDSFNKFLSS